MLVMVPGGLYGDPRWVRRGWIEGGGGATQPLYSVPCGILERPSSGPWAYMRVPVVVCWRHLLPSVVVVAHVYAREGVRQFWSIQIAWRERLRRDAQCPILAVYGHPRGAPILVVADDARVQLL